MLGYSDNFIMSRTHLTKGQIAYRIRLAGVKRRDYRDGVSAVAKGVLKASLRSFEPTVRRALPAPRPILEVRNAA